MAIEYKNPIWVQGDINQTDFFVNFTRRFSEIMTQTKEGDVLTVFINSPGGDTNTALGIYDLLERCERQTVGIVTGIAYSGASLILQGCRQRLMTAHSNLMLHKSKVQVSGSVQNAQEALNTFRSLDDKYYEIYAHRSGEKVDQISDMAYKDKYFTPQQALEAGLIDGII